MGPKHWMLCTLGLARDFGESYWDHRAEHSSERAGTVLKIQLFSFKVSSVVVKYSWGKSNSTFLSS